MTDAEIEDALRGIVAESMRVTTAEVDLDRPLAELGAESIDFLDMMVAVEHRFDVELCPEGMFAKLDELFGDDVLSQDGKLTELGVEVLCLRRPEAPPGTYRVGFPVAELDSLFTPRGWIRAVHEVADARPKKCAACGGTNIDVVKGARIRCRDCDTVMSCPSQADVLHAWQKRFVENRGTSGD